MNIVIPVCQKDIAAALRNLEWCFQLNPVRQPFTAYVSRESTFSAGGSVEEAARRCFQEVKIILYPPYTGPQRFPQPQNYAFRHAAQWMAKNSSGQPWLWWEQDAVLLVPDAFSALQTEYARAGKPFMGALGQKADPYQQQHLNGVAIYPADACRRNPALINSLQVAFDILGGWRVFKDAHISPLFQHVHSFDGPNGQPATFPDEQSLTRIRPEAVIFHRCKDDSLIKILSVRAATNRSVQTLCPRPRASLIQVLMRWKYGTGKWLVNRRKPISIAKASPGEPRLVHCLERHRQRDPDADRRVEQAQDSWITLYKSGKVIPAHVWNYTRDSGQIGDSRQLPFLKDILVAGLNAGRPDDHVMLTNDDTILHPGVVDYVLNALKTKPALSSFRINFERGKIPSFGATPIEMVKLSSQLMPRGDADLGRDLFAFRKVWLREHWHEIPDFVLGELEWDLIMAYLIRKDSGVHTTKFNGDQIAPECEMPKGYVLHERHNRVWTSKEQEASSAKLWNRRLATEFYCDNEMHSLITNKL